MRVLLDTNVLVRATPASLGGPAWEVLQRIVRGTHTLVTAPPLLLELQDVLQRPRVRKSLKLDDDEIGKFVVAVQEVAEGIRLPATIPPYVPDDPKDAALVQTAIIGRVDVLCTRDRHLLHPQVLAICQKNRIRVLSDIELLNELRTVEPGEPTA